MGAVKEILTSEEWSSKQPLEKAKARKELFALSLGDNPDVKASFNEADADTQKALYTSWQKQLNTEFPDSFKTSRSGVDLDMGVVHEKGKQVYDEKTEVELIAIYKPNASDIFKDASQEQKRELLAIASDRFGANTPEWLGSASDYEPKKSMLDKAVPMALRAAPPIAAGFLTRGHPAGVKVTAAFAGAGELAAEQYEIQTGQREKYSPNEVALNALFSMIPGKVIREIVSPTKRLAVTTAVRGVEGAAQGAGYEGIRQLIEGEDINGKSILAAGGIGAVFGTAFPLISEASSKAKAFLLGKTMDQVLSELPDFIKKSKDTALKEELTALQERAQAAGGQGTKLDTSAPEGAPTAITPEQAKADAVRYNELQLELKKVGDEAIEAGKLTDETARKAALDAVDKKRYAISVESEGIKGRNPDSYGMPPGKEAAAPNPENVSPDSKRVQLEEPPVEKVDIGPRDETVSTGDGVPTAKESAMPWEGGFAEAVAKKKAAGAPLKIETPEGEVGITFEAMNAERAKRGLPELERGEFDGNAETIAKAQAEEAANPGAAQKRVDEIEVSGQLKDRGDAAKLLIEYNRRLKELNSADDILRKAQESGDEAAITAADKLVKERSAAVSRLEEIQAPASSNAGSILQSLQLVMNKDFTAEGITKRMVRAKKGKAVTSEDVREANTLAEGIAKADEAVAEVQDQISGKKIKPTKKFDSRSVGRRFMEGLQTRSDEAMARISARLGKSVSKGVVEGENIGGLLSTENLNDLGTVATNYIVKGVSDFSQLAKKMKADFGDWIEPHLPKIWATAQRDLKIARMENAAERRITQLQKQIDQRTVFQSGKDVTLTSAQLERMKKEIVDLNTRVKSIREEIQPNELADKSEKRRIKSLDKQIAEFDRQIAKGEKTVRTKTEVELTNELERKMAERDIKKQEAEYAIELKGLEDAGLVRKSLANAGVAYNLARVMSLGGEFSPVLLQTGQTVFSHPIVAGKRIINTLLPDMFKGAEERRIANKILLNSERGKAAAKDYKIRLSEVGGKASAQEEFSLVNKKIYNNPVFRHTYGRVNDALTNYSNALKLDMMDLLSRSSKSLEKADKLSLGRALNDSFGASSLGFAEKAATVLGQGFTSPRFWTSRIKTLLGVEVMRATPATRGVIANELMRMYVGMGITAFATYQYLAWKHGEKNVKLELNPEKGLFNIYVGRKKYDVTAGMMTNLKAITKIGHRSLQGLGILEKDVNSNSPFYKDAVEIAQDYVMSKAHPTINYAGDMFRGEGFYGEKIDTLDKRIKRTSELFYPIAVGNIAESFASKPSPELDIPLVMLGGNVSVIPEKEKKQKQFKFKR